MPRTNALSTRRTLPLAFLLLFWWSILALTGSLRAAVPMDIQRIKARGALIVALPSFDAPPFFYSEGTTLRGLDIELAHGLAEALEVPLRFDRRAPTFNAVIDEIAKGEADVAVCKLSRTLARATRIRFSTPYLTFHHALAINRLRFADLAHGRELAAVIRHFTGSIGVIEQSSFADFAALNFPKAKLVRFRDWNAVVGALKRGDITAAYRDEFEINCLLKSDPRMALTLRSVTLTDTEDSLGIAVAPGDHQLLALIDLYLSQRTDKLTIDKVMKRFDEVRR